jgi:hypothetical protein
MVTQPGRSIFLLSPAHCGGRRARALLRPDATSVLARRLREGTLTLGEAFAFMSALYFRGKLAYARAFADEDAAGPSTLVITPTRGLVRPETLVDIETVEEFAASDIATGGRRFRDPLERDVATLVARLPPDVRVVLLGSIATSKYVEVLAPALGARLHFPTAFIGRGDMSRGGLLLRSAAAGEPLEYAPLDPAGQRRGTRPPRLRPKGRPEDSA